MTNPSVRPVRSSWAALATTFFTALSILVLSGCPTGTAGSGPVEVCTELAQQCRLRDGLLGVCTSTDGECPEPPCLICRPQH